MFFTLKLLKLGLKAVLLPFRVVAKLFRFLVGFAAGRARGNASVGSSAGHDEESRGGPDPIRDPERKNETPVEQTTESTASNTAGEPTASAAASGDRLLSPPQYAAVLGVLAFGQLLGLLAYDGNVDAVAGAIADVRFVAATPLLDAVYWGVLDAGSDWMHPVVAVAYAALYGGLGWRTYDGGAVPSTFARLAAAIFVANAAAYAVTPLLLVNKVPFLTDYAGYYTSNGTLLQIVVYGALMGVLYVSTKRLGGRPTAPPASSDGTAGRSEPAPWAQDDAPETDATPDTTADSADSAAEDKPVAAGTRDEQPVSEPAADSQSTEAADGASAGADEGAEADAPGAGGEPATGQPPDAAAAAPGEAAAAKPTEETDETGDEGADAERSEPAETLNEAEAALGRLAGDDADSRLAAAGDLQDLAAEDHDYLTGERLGDALDDEPDPAVRAALVDALAALDTNAATAALRDARFDPDPTVSDRAANHLN